MSKHDDGAEAFKVGCVFIGMGVILAILWFTVWPLALVALVFFAVAIVYELNQRKKHALSAIHYPVAPAMSERTPAGQWDKKIRSIRSIYQTISWEIEKNQDQPVIKELGEQILLHASELLQQAEQVSQSQRKLWLNVAQATATHEQVEKLQSKIDSETNAAIRETLSATLASKNAELASVSTMSDNARYLDALLDRAEAALSELRARIGLFVAKTDEFVGRTKSEELIDKSSQLQAISDAMKVTLGEIG